MGKKYLSRWLGIVFIFIFCLTGIATDFHQSYAFFPCHTEEAVTDAVSLTNHSASYRAERFSLPDYTLLSDTRETRVHYQYKNRENFRNNLSRTKGLSMDVPKDPCGCFLSITVSCNVSNLRTNSEKALVAYIHKKDGKKYLCSHFS